MAQHIEDHAAAVCLSVVPGWALGGDGIAFEYPITELSADRQDVSEEAPITQRFQLYKARQPQFILHNAVFQTGCRSEAVEFHGVVRIRSGWFFTVNMFAGLNRPL